MAGDNSCKQKNNIISSEKQEESALFIDTDQPKLKVKKSQISFSHLRRSLSLRRKSSYKGSRKVSDISTKSLNLDRVFPKVHSQVRKTKYAYSI